MLTVNVGKEQVDSIIRNINRVLRKYDEYGRKPYFIWTIFFSRISTGKH